jgi:hypothetical protein
LLIRLIADVINRPEETEGAVKGGIEEFAGIGLD